ncbi:hypothetical protein BP6252_08138 [Coleophoma cylindrospora]|uniref:Uncharacterized protein n=1 Tax=Coleophoma cylindrospora TaxID=1849047 RepID=A0A3D8RC29_9HELO|nr:hypothetical protein BP6252_08138 [Coleophoma cylindrospora]
MVGTVAVFALNTNGSDKNKKRIWSFSTGAVPKKTRTSYNWDVLSGITADPALIEPETTAGANTGASKSYPWNDSELPASLLTMTTQYTLEVRPKSRVEDVHDV